jgi:hypothetical protein
MGVWAYREQHFSNEDVSPDRRSPCRTVGRDLVGKRMTPGGVRRDSEPAIETKSLVERGGCARRVRHFLHGAVARSDEDFRHIRYDAILDGPEGGS